METEPAVDARPLQGQKVAFTGKLASMSRPQAIELVRANGGEWTSSVTRSTTLLVVGQDGWPLRKDGRLCRQLQVARRLRSITIISESEMLDQVGRDFSSHQRLSTAQLGEILNISGRQIREWVRHGLVQPMETVQGVHYFDYLQVSWAKTLIGLLRGGATPKRIRRSLQQLQRWIPDLKNALEQVSLKDGRLVVRVGQEQLADPTGQMTFDFEGDTGTGAVPIPSGPQTAAEWFQWGNVMEEEGNLPEAAKGYRQALLLGGPDADACFNLANVFYGLGRKEQAAERFRQVVEVDPNYHEAWNNLGKVLEEIGQVEEALDAYLQALQIEPDYADAHYNLADLLEQLDRYPEALPHWKAYLKYDQNSTWAVYARQRVSKT